MSFFELTSRDPLYVKVAADALLALHIGGGGVGMLAGAAALLVPKGGRSHALAGKTFLLAMLIMAGIGAAYPLLAILTHAAPLILQAPNAIAGIMTLYLLITAQAAVTRPVRDESALEYGGLLAAFTVAAAGVAFIVVIIKSPPGTLGTTPPQAFFVFVLVGLIAGLCDLKVILVGGISGAARLGRHLWRLCVSLTIATGSFFLGQEKVLPHFMQGSPWLLAPVFAPLALMAFWLVRVRVVRMRAVRRAKGAAQAPRLGPGAAPVGR